MKAGTIPALLCLSSLTASAQIRTETRVVLVDTIVTDKHGEYVHGLAAKDFRLWEDNKEQTILSVALEKGAATSRPRYLVLFFGGMEDSDRIAVRQAVSGFIDANEEANRRIAVVSYNGGLRIGQNFTHDAGRLKEAVKGAISSTAVLDTTRALGSLARSLGDLPGRKAIVFLRGGLPQSAIQRAELTAAIDSCNKSDVAVYPVDVRPRSAIGSGTGVRAVSQGAVGEEMIPVTGGVTLQGQKDDADPTVPVQREAAGSPDQQLLLRLAGGTGGFVIPNPGELQRGLQKIGEEQSEYYVLSFTPSDSKAASCHALRVKVDRGGTSVRARANYCESKPQDLLAGTLTGQDLERRAAAASTGTVAASMQVSYFYTSLSVARVYVAMEIPLDALKPTNQKGKPSGLQSLEVNFLGIASTADGEVAARFSDALKLDPGASLGDKSGKPLHYEKEFRIAPGKYGFTMAFSSGGESFGKLAAPLSVDSRQAGELAMSDLVLSKETQPAAELGLGMAGLLENRRPLITDDVQIVPAGSNQFAKSEMGFVYFEVYAPDPASVRFGMRVLDAKTGEPKSDSGLRKLSVPKGGGDGIPVASSLPISALAPGSYELEVTAVDSAGKQVRRTADLEVK